MLEGGAKTGHCYRFLGVVIVIFLVVLSILSTRYCGNPLL